MCDVCDGIAGAADRELLDLRAAGPEPRERVGDGGAGPHHRLDLRRVRPRRDAHRHRQTRASTGDPWGFDMRHRGVGSEVKVHECWIL